MATEQALIVYSPFNVLHAGERGSIPHQRVTIAFVSSGLLHLLHPHADLHYPDRIVLTYWPISLNWGKSTSASSGRGWANNTRRPAEIRFLSTRGSGFGRHMLEPIREVI